MTDTVTGCAKTPLSDLLRRIPQEAVYSWTNPEEGRERWHLGSESAPIGRLAHEAADALDAMLAASPQGEKESDCVCVQRGDSPEGCGLCNETGVATHPTSPQGEGSSADAAPIKPSADTGELRKRVAHIIGEAVNRRAPGQIVFSTLEDADAILDLIQSERAG